jgi:hypothetical protein
VYRRGEAEEADALARMEKTKQRRRTAQRENCAENGRYWEQCILKGLKYGMIVCGAYHFVASIYVSATFVGEDARALLVSGTNTGRATMRSSTLSVRAADRVHRAMVLGKLCGRLCVWEYLLA